jgi:HK97 family phage portal protein
MGFLLKPRAATYNDTEGWFYDWVTGKDDDGSSVNERNAMRISTVWKCVRARAETFGMIPKKLFERVEILGRASQKEAREHSLFDVIHTAPNPAMSSMAYFELMSADLDLWGNNYSYIERFPNSLRVRYLWRIPPDLVRLYIDPQTDELWYLVRDGSGVEVRFYPDEILHIRGLGFDGYCGYSPIQMQKRALQWNSAAVQQNSHFYQNASRPSFIVTTQNALKDKAKDSLIKSLTRSGKDAGKGILVEGPLDVKMLQFSPDDMKFVETAQLQEEDICGIFRVPPHKVGILRRSTNNNIEHQDIEWVRDSIQPICERVEQWMDLQLLSDRRSSGLGGGTERERYFVECDLKGLLRGDTAAQTEHIREMINWGVYSQNDARDYLGQTPIDGGDRYWMNSANIPIDKVDEFLGQRNTTAGAANPNSNTMKGNETAAQDRIEKAFGLVFKDAVGRLMARKPADREKAAPGTFYWLLFALSEGLGCEWDSFFADDYLKALGKRAVKWEEFDGAAPLELSRAIKALLERTTA